MVRDRMIVQLEGDARLWRNWQSAVERRGLQGNLKRMQKGYLPTLLFKAQGQRRRQGEVVVGARRVGLDGDRCEVAPLWRMA